MTAASLLFIAARLGGDEFAILLEQAPSDEVAVRVDEVLREADVAMYTAKARFELASTSPRTWPGRWLA